MPEDFRFYDLRHAGHPLTTVRAGQSSEKAALIHQHSDDVPRRSSIWHAAADQHGQQKGPGL
jgi:hypothetical protein